MPRRPSDARIRESHDVVRRVRRGEVTPHCQKAKAAQKVVEAYPDPQISEDDTRFDWLSTMYEKARTPDIVDNLSRRAVAPAPMSAIEPSGRSADKDVLLQVLFGSAAPQAEKALDFLQTKRGQQALGVGSVALGTYLTVRMVS